MEQNIDGAAGPGDRLAVRHRDGGERLSARGQLPGRRALLYLYPLADKDLLARIRNARLPQSHFECILQALQSSFIYDRLIISWVNELPQPELAAEVADFLIRFEEIDWAVCAGVFEDKLILSARAAVADAQAGEILRQVVGKLGRAGGHDRRAGGTILLPSTSASAVEQIQGELRRRLLKALHIDECRGQRLVSRRGFANFAVVIRPSPPTPLPRGARGGFRSPLAPWGRGVGVRGLTMPTCPKCGAAVEGPIGFRGVCPSCHAYLHCCVNCRSVQPQRAQPLPQFHHGIRA